MDALFSVTYSEFAPSPCANVLMPVLFVILVTFCVNSLMMPGARDGLAYLFKPDFSKDDNSTMVGVRARTAAD